jgi:hypothetical protein
MLADLADATDLSTALGEALAPLRQRDRGHDPGRVALDLAVMLADGGEAIADLAVLRNQSDLFGPVASDATAWRVLNGIDDAVLAGIRTARARAREVAWAQASEAGTARVLDGRRVRHRRVRPRHRRHHRHLPLGKGIHREDVEEDVGLSSAAVFLGCDR